MDIEIPMTEAKANAFARKLFRNHKKEISKWKGPYRMVYHYWRKKHWEKVYYNPPQGPMPFIKIEFERISA